jgi:hypothetical protein
MRPVLLLSHVYFCRGNVFRKPLPSNDNGDILTDTEQGDLKSQVFSLIFFILKNKKKLIRFA